MSSVSSIVEAQHRADVLEPLPTGGSALLRLESWESNGGRVPVSGQASLLVDLEASAPGPSTVQQGISMPEPNRRTVRSNLHGTLGLSLVCWRGAFICGILLLLGFVCVLLWSSSVFNRHGGEACGRPFGFMLAVLLFLLVLFIGVSNRHRITHFRIMGLWLSTFNQMLISAIMLWPMVCLAVLTQADGCSPALTRALFVLSLYIIVGMFVAVIVSGCFIKAMYYLAREARGSMDEVMTLPSVQYDSNLFDDDGSTGRPQCSICLEEFDAVREMTKTRCRPVNHFFHTACLAGWARCAITCPVCRQDLRAPGVEMSSGGA